MTVSHQNQLRVAYLLHRFPYRTETFIVREMDGLVEAGVDLSIFSMMAPGTDSASDQGNRLLTLATYSPPMSLAVVVANLHMLARRPFGYVRALARLVARTWREPSIMALTVGLFPKTVLFAREIERRGVDHIHAHFVWVEGLAAGVIRDLTATPFTIQPHAFGLFGRNQTNVRLELQDATGIVTISEYNKAHIGGLDSHLVAKTDVVHCGVEIERFQPRPDRATGDQPVRIASIGRAVEKKGHRFLIDACALLYERNVAFECELIVGSDEATRELQRRIDGHGIGDRVWLRDMVDEAGVVSFLHRADIFALACVVAESGDRDGIPVVIMEAMACGLPVVSTTVSGVPELVREGSGILTAPGDPEAIAAALERLIVSPDLRASMGQRGRCVVAREFDAVEGAARMREIFERYRREQPSDAESGGSQR